MSYTKQYHDISQGVVESRAGHQASVVELAFLCLSNFSEDSWTAKESCQVRWLRTPCGGNSKRNKYIDDARLHGSNHMEFCIGGCKGCSMLGICRNPRGRILGSLS